MSTLTAVEPILENPVAPNQWYVRPTAVIIASGPSLTQEDADFCRQFPHTIVVNDSWRMAPWAQVLYACDWSWWDYHKGVPEFNGQKWTQIEITGNKHSAKTVEQWGLKWIRGAHRQGISFDRSLIHYGSNSGYQALNLAIHFGATKIILLGFDMMVAKDGRTHWHGNHPASLNRRSHYETFVKKFAEAVPDLTRNNIKVVNCTRNTALRCFPKMSLHDALGESH